MKGNIATQVGSLYDPADAPRRTRAFVIFNVGINVGATAGPLLCGLMAQVWGWHAGFAMAGVLMFGLRKVRGSWNLRLSPEEEMAGIDLTQHGVAAYNVELGQGVTYLTPDELQLEFEDTTSTV